MTKNSALKRDARAYQREHPGTRLADAMRAVPRSTATDGAGPTGGRAKPWIQRTDVETGCYFCGRDSVILSYTDLHEDHGRVEIYCDNGDCDAREIEVIIIEDGTSTTRNRTDVRILNHFGPDGDRPAGTNRSGRARDATRTRPGSRTRGARPRRPGARRARRPRSRSRGGAGSFRGSGAGGPRTPGRSARRRLQS